MVEECSPASGDTCGALFLDKGFESLLRRKLGTHANTILKDRRIDGLLRYFNNTIKRTFNPLGPRCDQEYEIEIGGVEDIPEINFEDGYLTLTRSAQFYVAYFEGTIFKVYLIQSLNKS
jgi:hypothetical protein